MTYLEHSQQTYLDKDTYEYVLSSCTCHNRHAGNLPYPSLQVFIVRRNNINPNPTHVSITLNSYTIKLGATHLCCMTRFTRQSSAYVPLWSHFTLSNLGSLAILSAILYLGPNFSNSAMTQSVMTGVAFAYRQSIMAWMSSSFFWILKLIKFVSTRTEYGGRRASLNWKKRDEAT